MINRRTILTGSVGAAALGVSGASAQAATQIQFNALDFGVEPNAAGNQSARLQRAIDSAIERGGYLFLPPGIYIAGDLKISAPFCLQGVPGLTRLVFAGRKNLLRVANAHNVTVSGIIFDGIVKPVSGRRRGLVSFDQVENLTLEQCEIRNSAAHALTLSKCSGRIVYNTFANGLDAAVFAIDSRGLEISHNNVDDMADNGVLVWQSKKREDGSIISHNRIQNVGNKSGGSGQYGNGINIFRGGNVMAVHNRISDCAYSAVRSHSGSNVQILANNCSRLGEVAIYSEFAFEGAVISDNVIDDAATGISITNFNDGGRLAVCANNVVRRLHRRPPPSIKGVGITVEADTVVTGNLVEDAPVAGISLGWSWATRDISATGNIVRRCGVGIMASVADRAKKGLIANNIISGSTRGAIIGMDHNKPATADLAQPDADIPPTLTVTGNLVS